MGTETNYESEYEHYVKAKYVIEPVIIPKLINTAGSLIN